MIDNNSCAYKEIYEILKIFPKELVEKVPEEKMNFFKENMDINYEYNISKETFDGKTMLEETKAILTILFRDYWALPEERKKLIYNMNSAKYSEVSGINYEELLNKKYKEKSSDETDENQVSNLPAKIDEKQENFFKRLWNNVIKIFKK